MQKRTILYVMLLVGIFCSPAYSQMANGSVGVKVDYISFPDSNLGDADVDAGIYYGLEAYKSVLGGLLQVGGEIGYANPDGEVKVSGTTIKSEFRFVPVEANAKFVSHLGDSLSYSIGLGLSMIFVDADLRTVLAVDEDNWLWGGQFFGELNYAVGNFIIGLDAKYHWTESFKDDDYHNIRAGAHIGWQF